MEQKPIIKNCPFCGGEAVLKHERNLFTHEDTCSYVECTECHASSAHQPASSEYSADEKVIQKWNASAIGDKSDDYVSTTDKILAKACLIGHGYEKDDLCLNLLDLIDEIYDDIYGIWEEVTRAMRSSDFDRCDGGDIAYRCILINKKLAPLTALRSLIEKKLKQEPEPEPIINYCWSSTNRGFKSNKNAIKEACDHYNATHDLEAFFKELGDFLFGNASNT